MISIVFISWNHWNLTAKFLQNVYEKFQSEDYELIVVDNGSSDLKILPRLETQKRMFFGDRLTVISAGENLGFSGGNNLGAQYASGDMIMFTQPDVEFFDDILPYVWQLRHYDNLFGARLLNYDTGWNKFTFADGEYIISYLEGWMIFCNKVIWDEVGGWDEDYFPTDYEDVQLSMDFVNRGYAITESRDVRMMCRHNAGSSIGYTVERENLTKRHRDLFYDKWGRDKIIELGVPV